MTLPTHFSKEEAAFSFLEKALWPEGPVCCHCGSVAKAGYIKANPEKRVRHGLYRCHVCQKQFTVTVGTVFEGARLPLHRMLQAFYLIYVSEKPPTAKELHVKIGVAYLTAKYLLKRMNDAVKDGTLDLIFKSSATPPFSETDFNVTASGKSCTARRGFASAHPRKPRWLKRQW